METVLVVAVVVCSLLGAACCELFWIWLTGLAPLCIKRAYSRYFIRGVVKRKDKGMPFSATMIEPRLFLGSMPHEPEDLKALRAEHGVSAIVTMNEQWELPFYLSIAAILGAVSQTPNTAIPPPTTWYASVQAGDCASILTAPLPNSSRQGRGHRRRRRVARLGGPVDTRQILPPADTGLLRPIAGARAAAAVAHLLLFCLSCLCLREGE